MSDPLTIIAVDGAPNLAVDVQPDAIEGTFVLDVDELDGAALLGWGDALAGAWLNIVCDITAVRVRRGVSRVLGILTRAEAGTATIDVLDHDRRFDPLLNADAIHAGTPLRLRAWGGNDPAAPEWSAALFTADLDDVPVTYPRSGPPRVTLTASDVIAPLAMWASEGRAEPGVGADEGLRARVERVFTEVGLDSAATISPDSDVAYAATLAPSTLAHGWDDVTAAADAELGRVWVDRNNRLVIRGRESQLSGPVRGTLSDWHDESVDYAELHCCYSDLAAALGTESLANRVIGARRVPVVEPAAPDSAVITRDDAYSQARYRRTATVDRRDLELDTDGQLAPWAESVLVTSSRPELRVDSVAPAPWGAGAQAWQAVCSTDVGDRWALRYHPELGPTVMRTLGVLGIEHEITPEGWSIVWHTTDAPTPGLNPTGWFALDVSELDSGDLLALYGGAVGALPS